MCKNENSLVKRSRIAAIHLHPHAHVNIRHRVKSDVSCCDAMIQDVHYGCKVVTIAVKYLQGKKEKSPHVVKRITFNLREQVVFIIFIDLSERGKKFALI